MAWVQVDKQTSTNTWGSAPPISTVWEFTAFRDDVTNELLIRTKLSATYVSGYFGYNIQVGCFIINDSYMQGSIIKNNTPNTWGTVSGTYEWNLGVYEETSVLGAAAFASNSGRAQLDLRLSLNTPLLDLDIDEPDEPGDVTPDTGLSVTGVQLFTKSGEKLYPLGYFPIGAIYMSTSSTSPSSLYGGTWMQIKDRFLIGAGASYSIGEMGGSATHTLTVAEMPSHSHTATAGRSSTGSGTRYSSYEGETGTSDTIYSTYTGGSGAHDNMPPYTTVFTWQRVKDGTTPPQATDDGRGNVTLIGVDSTHDDLGNVTLIGWSSASDGNGNITLTL